MVSEQGLVKAMNKAFSSIAGYTIAMVDDLLYIQTECWEVLIRMEQIPRKVLALTVEHVGSILKDGEAYQCSKKGGAQLVAAQFLWESLSKLRESEPTKEVAKTKLHFEGNEIWQGAGSLEVVALRPEHTGIIDIKEPGVAYLWGQSVLWMDDALVHIGGVRMPTAVVQYLSGVQWIGGKD